jgi:ribonuclease Z
MATDMMVWNVRRNEIIERMAVSPDDAWDVPGPGQSSAPDPDFPSQYTEYILKGRFDATDAEKKTREVYNQKYGLE